MNMEDFPHVLVLFISLMFGNFYDRDPAHPCGKFIPRDLKAFFASIVNRTDSIILSQP